MLIALKDVKAVHVRHKAPDTVIDVTFLSRESSTPRTPKLPSTPKKTPYVSVMSNTQRVQMHLL